jgi:predicted nucleic acid-binding protein
MTGVYLDSSAIVKLAVREPESDALLTYLRRRTPWVSSAIARTEVLRALLGGGEAALAAGRGVLSRCDLVRVNDRVLNIAGTMDPPELRSLDAIHLATAERLREEIQELIIYDERMASAARQLGFRVSAPE